MAKVCSVCGKTSWTGFKLSHSHIRTKRTWSPNLRRKKIWVNGVTPKRILACASCIRKNKHLEYKEKKG